MAALRVHVSAAASPERLAATDRSAPAQQAPHARCALDAAVSSMALVHAFPVAAVAWARGGGCLVSIGAAGMAYQACLRAQMLNLRTSSFLCHNQRLLLWCRMCWTAITCFTNNHAYVSNV